MKLSADSLNLRSPYHLLQLGDLTFRFITDQQIHYTVGFYKDTIFMDDGAYHFILSYFQDFLKHVPQLYTPREK